MPIEFQILGYRPEPWRPADSLVWGKLQALQLSANFREELLRARLLTRLTPREVDDLFPTGAGPVTLAADLLGSGGGFASLLERVAGALPTPPVSNTASNEWVVAGARTSTGRPILANDPHLSLGAPVLWYLARLETPELTLAGATVPGLPFHLLGNNGTIAWGMTATGSDTQDVFVERLDANDPTRYQSPDGAMRFTTRSELIKVRGGTEHRVSVRASRHGPVLADDSPLADTRPAPGYALSLAFTGLSANDTTAEALYRLDRARTWDDFVAALRLYQTPQVNIVYADTSGAIGFYAPGLVPVRGRGKGLVPVPGWETTFDWTGTVPFDALPHALNPPSGRFINANNAPTGPDYPYLLAARWPDPSRAQRIAELLDRDGQESTAASLAIQQDTVSLPARRLLPLMLPRPGADTEALSRTARAAVALLQRWNGTMGRDAPEPLIFSWWLREFNRLVFADRLGPMFPEYWDLHPDVVEHILSEAPTWCDQMSAPGTRTCSDALRSSLETAVRTLADRYGDHPELWRWGDEHRAGLEHALLSRIPGLGWLFDIGVETDGDAFTINRGISHVADPDKPFADVHGPGLRSVYDLADLDQSLFMIATGQSGNPLSPHYGDRVTTWRDGAMISLAPLKPGPRARTLVLTPAGR